MTEFRRQKDLNSESRIGDAEFGIRNEVRKSWEGRKLRSSKLNAQREPSAVGGALCLRLEAEKVYLPLLLNQRINALTNQPDLIEPWYRIERSQHLKRA